MTTNKQIIFGLHAVDALLRNQPERAQRLCVQKGREDNKISAILELAKSHQIPIEFLPRKELDDLTREANHQGIVAFTTRAHTYNEHDIPRLLESLTEPPFILILDGVQDPHNLGACFRSADAAGVHMVIAPKDKSVGLTPVVSKVASGAAEILPFVQVTNLARTLKLLKDAGIWIFGAAGEAEQVVYHADLTGPVALVLGAEGEGMRRLTREHCDVLVKIPMFGSVSSLNVSVATGVLLFEAVRQRTQMSD